MIEKMRFVNIIGPKDDIDRMTDTYLSKYDIHLENTLTELASLNNVYPFIDTNPYQDLLKKVSEMNEYIHVTQNYNILNTSNVQLTTSEASSIIINAYETYTNITNELKHLKEKKIKVNENLNIVSPFRNLTFQLSDITSYQFIKFRFGKLLHEHYEQFMKYQYDKQDVIFIESNIDETYVWGIYFTPAIIKDKVDAIFSSLHFERIYVPEDYNGTGEESYTKYLEDLSNIDSTINKLNIKLKKYFKDNHEHIVNALSIITKFSKNRDVKKLAACTVDPSYVLSETKHSIFYIICGWLSENDAINFEKSVENDPDVFCLFEDSPDMHLKPPTKLRNPSFFKPFEMFVNMYGLPSYNELDPTIFLAFTYSILFGFMFGDIGQGALLFLGGTLLYKFKKINIAGIIGLAGFFSIIFGFAYGSIFGFEDIIKPLWTSPMHNVMTVLISTVIFGMILNLLAMILNIINGIKNKNIQKIFFDTNGLSGFIFYVSIIIILINILMGNKFPSTYTLLICLGIPLLIIFLREPITNLIKKRDHFIEGSKIMFFVESFFEMFEILLSFITNSLSFIRVGAFALSHAGLMSVVLLLAGANSNKPNILILILGNLFVMALESLTVAIQVLRLQYYEMFSRYYDGSGKPFTPLRKISKY